MQVDPRDLGGPNTDWFCIWSRLRRKAVVVSKVTFSEFSRRRRVARGSAAVIAAWRQNPDSHRDSAIRECLNADPENPMGWFLLGCYHLSGCRIRDAARYFGMAYHQDVRIESAALLTFACLKAREGQCTDILDQIAVTWIEMRRPRLMESAVVREAMEVVGPEHTPESLSELGRLAWAFTDDRQREALSAPAANQHDKWRPLFA